MDTNNEHENFDAWLILQCTILQRNVQWYFLVPFRKFDSSFLFILTFLNKIVYSSCLKNINIIENKVRYEFLSFEFYSTKNIQFVFHIRNVNAINFF